MLVGSLPKHVAEKVLTPWRKLYWWQQMRNTKRRTSRIAAAIVRSGKPIKLELGSGKRPGMEDWIAADLGGSGDIQLDFTQPMPFPNGFVEQIYSSHVLEHFSYPHPLLSG